MAHPRRAEQGASPAAVKFPMNSSNIAAPEVVIVDRLPAGLLYVSGTAAEATFGAAPNTLTWTILELAGGGEVALGQPALASFVAGDPKGLAVPHARRRRFGPLPAVAPRRRHLG